MQSFDIGIIGSGPGGYVAAIRAAQLGASVCVIEYREVGGTCLNRGCIPTKAMLHSAHVYKLAKTAAQVGIQCSEPKVDMAGVHAHKDKVVGLLCKGVAGLLKKNKVTVIAGKGKLASPTEILVESAEGDQKVRCRKIVVATGSESRKLDGVPYDGQRVLTSDDLLTLPAVPQSMLVVGAGAIGCEWAGMFLDFGAGITIVEVLDQVLPGMDADVGKEMLKHFKKAKASVYTKTSVETLVTTDSGVKAELSNGKTVEAEKALVAVGRSMNSDGLGLDELGIETEKGAIRINESCQTSLPNVYAIGDVTGKVLLAHLASKQGIVAVEHALDHPATIDYRTVPACIYTEPEVASVGMTEAQAKEAGHEVKAAKWQYQASGKAQAMNAATGFVKIVGDAQYGEILGASIVGSRASDMIAEIAVAMRLESTIEEIADTIHPHPTLAEGIMETAEAWYGRAIHA